MCPSNKPRWIEGFGWVPPAPDPSLNHGRTVMTEERNWFDISRLAAPIEIGLLTSACSITYGCGHTVYRMNGDAAHGTCPYCYVKRISA